MTNVTVDRNSVGGGFKATASVSSDNPFFACEARATAKGGEFGRGIGLCLLGDDSETANGAVSLPAGASSFTFDVEADELSSDGEYRISVFTMDENGVWDDCARLNTNASQPVCDKNTSAVRVKRTGGAETSYTSAYSGDEINNFVSGVMG